MKKHGAGWSRPGAINPWKHNAVVARRKKYRRLARQFKAASAQPGIRGLGQAFLDLGRAADRAAESLRGIAWATPRSTPRDPRVARDLARRGVA